MTCIFCEGVEVSPLYPHPEKRPKWRSVFRRLTAFAVCPKCKTTFVLENGHAVSFKDPITGEWLQVEAKHGR